MTLQRKYEIAHIMLRFTPGDAVDQFTLGGEVLVTTTDDAAILMTQISTDRPEYTWAQLSAPIQATLITLRNQIIAALKVKYGTTAVTIWGQP